MRIEFEEYYGSTPFICRNCFLDCSECPYDADIFTLARVDELLLKSDCGSKRSGGQKRIWRKLNSNLKRSARDKGFACISFSARKSRKQNYSIRQCLHWLMQATPWPADRVRIPHIYAKCGPPEWVTRILARDKGFEPLTFWSVAMANPFYNFPRLTKTPDFMRLSACVLFASSHNLWRFRARLCTKCARNVHGYFS